MTTLKETVNKLTKLYSDLNDCNDGFTCSMIINDIELTLKSYGRECSKASLDKASESIDYEYTYAYSSERNMGDTVEKSIIQESNIVLL